MMAARGSPSKTSLPRVTLSSRVISTGSTELDGSLLLTFDQTPWGGLPRGRLVELAGEPQAGTTTLGLSLALQTESSVWYDADCGGLPPFIPADQLPEDVLLATPDSDQPTELLKALLFQIGPLVDLVVIDSWDAALPRGEGQELIPQIAQMAQESQTLVVLVTKRWESPKLGRKFSRDESYLRTYCSLGIYLPSPGRAQLLYSRLGPTGRATYFGYTGRMGELLEQSTRAV